MTPEKEKKKKKKKKKNLTALVPVWPAVLVVGSIEGDVNQKDIHRQGRLDLIIELAVLHLPMHAPREIHVCEGRWGGRKRGGGGG